MTTVTINVTTLAARDKLARLKEAIGAGPILKVIGMRLLAYVDESFKTHGRGAWRPLAPLTVEFRRGGSSEPLQDTGRLKQSYVQETDGRTFVEVGSNLKTPDGQYSLAKIHEFGTGPYLIPRNGPSTARHGMIARTPGGRWVPFGRRVQHPGIPARPVLPTAATAERLVVETVTEMIEMQVGRT